MIYNRPTVPEMGNQEEMKRQQALAEEAYEDLAESLRYHLRIANTAVEYYQNQVKQEFVGMSIWLAMVPVLQACTNCLHRSFRFHCRKLISRSH